MHEQFGLYPNMIEEFPVWKDSSPVVLIWPSQQMSFVSLEIMYYHTMKTKGR